MLKRRFAKDHVFDGYVTGRQLMQQLRQLRRATIDERHGRQPRRIQLKRRWGRVAERVQSEGSIAAQCQWCFLVNQPTDQPR